MFDLRYKNYDVRATVVFYRPQLKIITVLAHCEGQIRTLDEILGSIGAKAKELAEAVGIEHGDGHWHVDQMQQILLPESVFVGAGEQPTSSDPIVVSMPNIAKVDLP